MKFTSNGGQLWQDNIFERESEADSFDLEGLL